MRNEGYFNLMNNVIKILTVIALLLVIIGGGLYIYKSFIAGPVPEKTAPTPTTAAPTPMLGALIRDLKFGVVPPNWKPKPGYRAEYKTVFSAGQQIMLDFFGVAKDIGVEVIMLDENGQEANFFAPPLQLRAGDNGNCCYTLPLTPGKYTVKVFSEGQEILSRNLEIK